jgi:hypothetical protein
MSTIPDRNIRKRFILDVRQQFFSDLLHEWSRPPEHIDEIMGQVSYFIAPSTGLKSVYLNDPAKGLLMQSFAPPESWGKKMQFIYSIWMAGDWIRYGVLLQGDAKILSTFTSNHEHTEDLERVWDRPAAFSSREGGLLMEWRFEDPNFYDDYIFADRYLQIARHLHFQLGHSIHEAYFKEAFT